MRNEYRSGYAEGGFLDDGASVDPVSGNEVPTGSLAEEVRDDIPAQLSEGEFVVPADVVRFIGLDKLMKMRESAKAGLANMEAEGQMGGSPAPMQQPEMDDEMEMDALIDGMDNDDFEGAAQMFAEGGAVTDLPSYNTTKAASTAGTLGDMPTYKKYTGGREFNVPDTVTYVKYTNDAGDIIDVATVRGKPVNPVPDGYYLVGSKGDEGGVSRGGSSAQTRSTVNSGPSQAQQLDRDYKNSTSYKNQLNKSMQIMGARSTVLETLHKDNMTQEEIDTFYDHLTPQAQAEYESRFRDLKGLDKFFASNKSSVELMKMAQGQVNARNLKNGVMEVGSFTAPSGKILTAEGIQKSLEDAFKGTAEGIKALSLGPIVFAQKLAEALALKYNTREGNGKAGDGNDPSPRPTVSVNLGQEHWKNRLNELTVHSQNGVIDSAAIQKILRHEQRSAVNASGKTVDAYNNTLVDPSRYTVWDKIAERQSGDVAIAQASINESDSKTKSNLVISITEINPEPNMPVVDSTTVNSIVDLNDLVTPTLPLSTDTTDGEPSVAREDFLEDDFISPTVDRGLLAAAMQQMETDATVGAADTRDEALDTTGAADTRDEALDNVGSGTRYSPAAGTEYSPEGTGVASLTDVDPSTPAIKPVVDSQLKMDIRDVANPVDTSAVTTGIPSANIISGAESDLMSLLDAEDALDTGATLGTVGTTGVTAGVTPMTTTMTTAQKKQANLDNIAAIAVANGLDPDDAIDAWNASGKTGTLADLVVEQEKVVKQQKKQDRQDRQDAYDRQVAKVAKEEADRKAAADLATQKLLDDQARLQGDRTPTPPPVTLPDQVNSGRFDPSPSTVNSGNDGNGPKGNNSGPVGGSTSGPKSRGGRQRQQRSQQQNSGREDYAYGGLALKKEPVKKMRNDPTSGLASKKKAKQKAQAKKGALAAKRT